DPEGRLLSDIRRLVGKGVPIVASLDMHAHVTDLMIQNADALVAFRNYPHDDTYETGIRAAELLLEILSGDLAPCMVVAKVPMLCSGVNGMTFGDAPMAQLKRMAMELENQEFIRSVSVIHVQPTNDLPDMGCGALIVCNDIDKIQHAVDAAKRLAMEMWDRRQLFEPDTSNVDEAVARGLKVDGGPIILIDTADCAGGGAAGDSNDVLERLIALKPAGRSLVMVVDPAAAMAAAQAGVGSDVSLNVGYGVDSTWGKPICVTGTVKTITNGNFLYSGGAYGNTVGRMGLSVVLEIGKISLLIMSKPTYDWRDEQYRAAGCNPTEYKFVVAKNPVNFRYAYADIAKEYILLDTPGPTPASMKNLPYKIMRRPFFPLDKEINNISPTIYTNEGRLRTLV
ncbi:MAG: M81 family metallopeptidase, partial [Burkholderiaceae bacterium]